MSYPYGRSINLSPDPRLLGTLSLLERQLDMLNKNIGALVTALEPLGLLAAKALNGEDEKFHDGTG